MPMREFAARINRHPDTIRRWEREGRISPKRTDSGHRIFTEEDVNAALGIILDSEPATPKTIVYLRVSSPAQKDDLTSQRCAMETWALNSGTVVDEWVEEIGSGLNFTRKKLTNILDEAMSGTPITVIVAHKDRLARFGFELIEHVIENSGGSVVVVNQESLSPTEELVQDILAILHVFSSRLYGLRRYEKSIRINRKDLR